MGRCGFDLPLERPSRYAGSVGETREEILQELIQQRPRLLSVERIPGRGPALDELSRSLRLSFDAGSLLVERAPRASGLRVALDAEEPEPRESVVRADEDDPWWAVIGNELARAWAVSAAEAERSALELQFRRDDDDPKLISLELLGANIRVSARPKG